MIDAATANLDQSAAAQQAQTEASDRFQSLAKKYAHVPPPARSAAAFDDVWQALAEVGFFSALIPTADGGTAAGLHTAALILEELAAANLSNFLPVLTAIDVLCIATHGSDDLRARFLPEIAAGRRKLCFAATERESGSNVFQVKTHARRDGDHYVVTGDKLYISGADVSDDMVLVCRTKTPDEVAAAGMPKTFGLSLLIVPTDSPGLEKTPVTCRGESGIKQFELRFHDVRVPADRLLGPEDGGAMAAFASFNAERVLVAATALGATRYCLDLACEHARTRRVFRDMPIGAYQSIQHPLADVAIRAQAVRLLAHRAAARFDAGEDTVSVSHDANSAKYLAAELLLKAVDASLHTFGGKGFDESHGLVHLWDAARFMTDAPIANTLILNIIAEQVLNLPRSY